MKLDMTFFDLMVVTQGLMESLEKMSMLFKLV